MRAFADTVYELTRISCGQARGQRFSCGRALQSSHARHPRHGLLPMCKKLCLAGIVLVALGVSFEVAAQAVTLPGEGLALALCRVIRLKFGYMKVIVDVSLVIIAVALSFGFLHGLQGVREGTLAAAIFVGLLAKQINRLSVPLADKWIEGNSCGQEGNRTE